jgi:hypothetical protein
MWQILCPSTTEPAHCHFLLPLNARLQMQNPTMHFVACFTPYRDIVSIDDDLFHKIVLQKQADPFSISIDL